MRKTEMLKVHLTSRQFWIFSLTVNLLVAIQPPLVFAQNASDKANSSAEQIDIEPKILSEINRVRTNPQNYAQWLESQRQYYDGIWLRLPGEKPVRTNRGKKALEEAIAFLREQQPLPPLESSDKITATATSQLANFANANNIQYFSYGRKTASGIVMDLVVDELFPDRRRRLNLLSPEAEDTGVVCKPDPRYAKVCAIAYSDSPSLERQNSDPTDNVAIAQPEPEPQAEPEPKPAVNVPETEAQPEAELEPEPKPQAPEPQAEPEPKPQEPEESTTAALPTPPAPQAPPTPKPESNSETGSSEAEVAIEDLEIAQAESEIEQEQRELDREENEIDAEAQTNTENGEPEEIESEAQTNTENGEPEEIESEAQTNTENGEPEEIESEAEADNLELDESEFEESAEEFEDEKQQEEVELDGEEAESSSLETEPAPEVAINTETAGFSEIVEEGVLEEGDRIIEDDGSLYDFYPIEGKAGESFTISLKSDEFDAFVAVVDSSGKTIGENDDISQSDSNSQVEITLPEDGVYNVIVNTYDENGTGKYVLTVNQ